MELVRNGGFEESGDWIFPSTPNQAHYTWGIVHRGERSVGLGIHPSSANQVGRTITGEVIDTRADRQITQDGVHSIAYQSLRIPGDADTAKLTFWHWLGSDDDEGDQQRVALISPTTFQVIAEPFSGLRHTSDWHQDSFDLTPFKGRDMLLYVDVYNDGDSQNTVMYLDDISLEACRVINES